MQNNGSGGHDIVVLGTSAGGVETLSALVASLPADLPAALFVVMHIPSYGAGVLPKILSRHSNLPVRHAGDGEPVQHGHIYIAPPDHHMILRNGTVHLSRGPRENGFRPAVDVLFRSAAMCYGARAVGVVLSGMLDDGTAGLRVIKAYGGVTIVQDPESALYPNMPQSAVDSGDADHVLPLPKIAAALNTLARRTGEKEGDGMDKSNDPDVEMVLHTKAAQEMGERGGEPSLFTCPECGGVLWEVNEGTLVRYRCHVGHLYSSESMLSEQADALETALWTAVRALEENVSFHRRLATRMRGLGHPQSEQRFLQQAADADRQAQIVRDVITGRSMAGSTEDAGSIVEGNDDLET